MVAKVKKWTVGVCSKCVGRLGYKPQRVYFDYTFKAKGRVRTVYSCAAHKAKSQKKH